MSLDVVLARMSQLQALMSPQPAPAPAPAAATPPAAASTTFSTALSSAGTTAQLASATPAASSTNAGQAIVNLVAKEVGVKEQPMGSNDSPRIAQFRQATAGSGVGPWCAYFTSWAAREAGVPLGDNGQGFGRVDDVYAWAQKSGKAVPNTGGDVKPQPGDLIVWDEHIGVVESVGPDGTINTIEGNSSDQVARRSYAPGARPAIGYVRLG
ncbi:CHAP domain-containing protein [Solirubrobacter sp. CPCC 204708]|uniref:CHAP domain-containing protein n=1 Tax=Solirubrobacter deserti TaxID=2282478 RepID=A0ABT4RMF5_9ACTN|nr:CHAP domain-containing protein [Solirubrobacter deserti]MBE2316893.1 CHAP domain-containing protein [Solirubrobacter deserti]MDA0139724.1 CHAP domain-containing protein [Solirubrobacter deserti]